MTKAMHAGLAVRAGVTAARFAQTGITASMTAFDAEQGVMDLWGDETSQGFDTPLQQLGNPLSLLTIGLFVKRYPCCGYISRAIDGVLAARSELAILTDEVSAMTIRIPDRNLKVLRFKIPESPEEARFSMYYCAAASLLKGKLDNADFVTDALADPQVLDVIARVSLESYVSDPDEVKGVRMSRA